MNKDLFVIKNLNTGKYIDEDHDSGGYPYDVELHRAKVYLTLESAEKYYKVCNWNGKEKWEIHRLLISSEPV